jgi:hypothetical protein
MPRRVPDQRIALIEDLRRQRMAGPAIARALGIPRSTVGLVLRRWGLGRLKQLEPKPPAVRYERNGPGEMIHLDIKKLGKVDGPATAFCHAGRACSATRVTAGTYACVRR